SVRACDRRQDRGRRRPLDPDLFPLCRKGPQAVRQARRYRDRRAAVVHGPSRRHGAGADDFISAATALNKARSAQNLAEIIDKRQRLLYEGKAVPLKEVQNARAALDAAENDVRSAEVALEATLNRLRILGKTDQEIT